MVVQSCLKLQFKHSKNINHKILNWVNDDAIFIHLNILSLALGKVIQYKISYKYCTRVPFWFVAKGQKRRLQVLQRDFFQWSEYFKVI